MVFQPSQASIREVFQELNTSEKGLSSKESANRLKKFGYNELQDEDHFSILKIFFSQFTNIMVLILIVAMCISLALGEIIDAVAIGTIVLINAVIGFVQEYKAERAIEALKKMAASFAVVIRDGKTLKIDARELVPGDVLLLEEGSKIPADARLFEVAEMENAEASLTGESTPVKKMVAALRSFKGLGDQINMVFLGTNVSKGHGKAVVVSTGMKTEFGKIAHMVQAEKSDSTPLQKKLSHLSKVLAGIAVLLTVILFAVGMWKGRELLEILTLSISLAISIIPEGLPAVITLTLALGVQKMAKKNAIVRKLAAAETLGSTSIICTDKTGTLTKNEMTVRSLWLDGERIEVTGSGYAPTGVIQKKTPSLTKLLEVAALCNNANLLQSGKKWSSSGDPTEACLLTLVKKGGLSPEALNKKWKRTDEHVFDSERKRMSTVHVQGKQRILMVKGAPDSVLKVCKLSAAEKKKILAMNDEMASDALRVLAFAYKPLSASGKSEEKDLIFVGLIGMMDPPRPEVIEALKICEAAHIGVVMITGDHAVTARAIGEEIGLFKKGDELVTGDELEAMSEAELNKRIEKIRIFARVSPSHKVKILKALKKKGHIVAMTGDGVNDAPALKSADIGVAMGITGTDVSKEASQMVLTDDNFATIVSSVESGRTTYRNIKKFIRFLLSANFDEVVLISVVFLLGFPLPLLPLQILWINLLTDSLPAIALGSDTAEKDIMSLKPRNPKANIFKELLSFSIVAGLLSAGVSLLIFFHSVKFDTIEHTRTLMFTTIVIFELFLVFSVRFEDKHYFTAFFKNHFLFLSVLFSLTMQLLVIYLPFFQKIFKTEPLGFSDWTHIVLYSVAAILLLEIWKAFQKKTDHV